MTEFYTSVIQYGSKILYRGYKNGRRVHEKVDFSPTLFVTAKNQSKYKTLYGQMVESMSMGSISEAKDFIKKYDDVEGFNVYGMTQYNYQYIADNFPGEVDYNLDDMAVSFIDIETASENGFPDPHTANEQVLLVSIYEKNTDREIVWGFREYNKLSDDTFEYILCKNEVDMLRQFMEYWQGNTPDILSGWNTEGYDIPYLINRITKILGDDWIKKLSPWGIVNSREVNTVYGKTTLWDIAGVVSLDYIELYKKYTYSSRESYALGFISQEELGETKDELEGSFKDQYTNQFDNFVRYNSTDSRLVKKIDDKLKFIELACTIAYLAKCNIKDTFGPVKTWDIFIYNYLKAKDIVIPQQQTKHGGSFEGAWVKEPIAGLHGWTMSFDFSSLYPNIIRQWNMSPETIVGVLPDVNVKSFLSGNIPKIDDDYTIAANGAMFRKDKLGIIPEVIKVILDGRKIAKKEMLKLEQEYNKTHDKKLLSKIASLNGKQLAFKIFANSLYGALTNVGFRYFDLRIGEAITLSGQVSDQHVEISFNEFMNKILQTIDVDYVIAGDTDSAYLNVDSLVHKIFGEDNDVKKIVQFLDKVGETKFQGVINKSIDVIYNYGNCFDRSMDMKRESIASRAIWTKKKRYAMIVHNSEGVDYSPYKLKIMGLDIIKSSTPKLIRKKLKEALTIIFEKDQKALYEYVSKVKKEFLEMPVEEISFPRGISDLTKYKDQTTIFKKATPIHVRGSLLYNHYNRTDNEVEQIKDGDKIKFIYLKTPNPIREDVIAFPSFGQFPYNLNLKKYIDYDKQWEKCFIAPLKGICDAIHWQPEKTSSLEEFFS